jgi:hypothetical protein
VAQAHKLTKPDDIIIAEAVVPLRANKDGARRKFPSQVKGK